MEKFQAGEFYNVIGQSETAVFRLFFYIFPIFTVQRYKGGKSMDNVVFQVIGKRSAKFKGSQGEDVSGCNFYLIYSLDKGEGHGTERVFATDSRLVKSGYVPEVGDMVTVQYNRFGKFVSFVPVEAASGEA